MGFERVEGLDWISDGYKRIWKDFERFYVGMQAWFTQHQPHDRKKTYGNPKKTHGNPVKPMEIL